MNQDPNEVPRVVVGVVCLNTLRICLHTHSYVLKLYARAAEVEIATLRRLSAGLSRVLNLCFVCANLGRGFVSEVALSFLFSGGTFF